MRLFVLMTFFSMLLIADGETIYKNKCASCHRGYIPMGDLKENFVEYNNTKLKLKGPTLNQLSFRLKQKIGDPNGDEEIHLMEVSEFIKDYINHPDKEKSVCMDEVLEAFNTMPSMKGKISDDDADEVSEYIYAFDQNTLEQHSVRYESFNAALQKAKDENKIIFLKATSEFCHYCKKMDREVLSSDEVVKVLNEKFVAVSIDVYDQKLPLDLTYKVTPTYFFIDGNGKLLKTVPGAFDKEDFLEMLKDIKK